MSRSYKQIAFFGISWLWVVGCTDDPVIDEDNYQPWVEYWDVREDAETQLYVDEKQLFRIIRLPDEPDVTGSLTDSQVETIDAVLTAPLFELYEQDSIEGVNEQADCTVTSERERVISLRWEERGGGTGEFGCWSDDVDGVETKRMLAVFEELTETLLDGR